MERPATRRMNQLRVNKLHKESSEAGNLQEISNISKPIITRLHSARVETKTAAALSTTLMSHSKSCRYPAHQNTQSIKSSQLLWDCGSSLYDSFELYSLNLQLDLAIKAAGGSSSKTTTTALISAPPQYLPELPPYGYAPPPPNYNNNLLSKVVATNQLVPKKCSRPASKSSSLNRILRSVFGFSKAEVTKNDDITTTTSTTSPSQFTEVKQASRSSSERRKQQGSNLYDVYDGCKSMRVLTTIPEVHETKLSPDGCRRPAVGRAVSERFAAHPVREYCP